MTGGQEEKFAQRRHDITSWQEGDTRALRALEKKRYRQREAAMNAYFTTATPLEQLALQHAFSVKQLLKMAEKCMLQHRDGNNWGFRALVPGARVVDFAPRTARAVAVLAQQVEEQRGSLAASTGEHDTATHEAADHLMSHPPAFVTTEPEVPATPPPLLMQSEDEDERVTAALSRRSQLAVARKQPPAQRHTDEHLALVRLAPPKQTVTTDVLPIVAPALPAAPVLPPKQTRMVAKRVIRRRLARKRRQRGVRTHTRNRRVLRIVSLGAVIAMLLFALVPVGAGMAAYGAYSRLSSIAHDGVSHLLKVKSLLNVSKTDFTSALDAARLQPAQSEFRAAESDFAQLQQLVNRPDVRGAISQFAPQYSAKLSMAQSLVQVGMDVSRMGDELSGVALLGANILHGSPLATGAKKPLVRAADVEAIDGAMTHALYYIGDIRARVGSLSIRDLPLSDSQKKQITALLPLLSKVEDALHQAQALLGLVAWLLGVDGQRRFLVQTLDRAELRPAGGFAGQYGILRIQDGRLTAPFALTDVTLIDYAENGTEIGRLPPPEYRSWMNFGNFGLRDANVSADFPTTARLSMQIFQDEGGGPLDGDIAFTPVLIEHVLDVVGPIKMPVYNETVTPQNLEEKLHLYQQNFALIAKEKQLSGDYSHAGRKAFTRTLGQILLDRVRRLKPLQLISIIKKAVLDLQSRDLEIYFTNASAEAWLAEHDYSSSMDTFARQDGFMVVQSNLSISKASQYVHTTEHDDVTLDAKGGATHNLTVTLDYRQQGPVYGFDTYADYMRIYAPHGAQLQGGSGFDSGHALCRPLVGAPAPSKLNPRCLQYAGSFGGARYCSSGNYALGLRDDFTYWPIDSLGPPTNLNSDLPGRAMWGGMTETPKNCTSTITLSWYVPHAVRQVHGRPAYTVLVQKQAGCTPTIELNIDASALKGLQSFRFSGDISTDRAFALAP